MSAPDPKPAKRIKATRDEWLAIWDEKRGPCRVCWNKGLPLPSLHHIVPKSAGGDDVADNIVPLCGSGTTGCHGLVEARDQRARYLLRTCFYPSELRYVIGKKGAAWLDRHYPPSAEDSTPTQETDSFAA